MEIVIDTRELDELASLISSLPVSDFLAELIERAERIVKFHYSAQIGAENTDYTTTITKGKDSATLTVSGADVGFLEFGAGIGTDPMNEFAEQVGFPIARGSYSNSRGGMYQHTNYTFWIWNRQVYEGKYTGEDSVVEATRGMQTALTNLRNSILDYMRKRIISYLNNGR